MYRLPVYTIRLVRESSLAVKYKLLAQPSAVADVLWHTWPIETGSTLLCCW